MGSRDTLCRARAGRYLCQRAIERAGRVVKHDEYSQSRLQSRQLLLYHPNTLSRQLVENMWIFFFEGRGYVKKHTRHVPTARSETEWFSLLLLSILCLHCMWTKCKSATKDEKRVQSSIILTVIVFRSAKNVENEWKILNVIKWAQISNAIPQIQNRQTSSYTITCIRCSSKGSQQPMKQKGLCRCQRSRAISYSGHDPRLKITVHCTQQQQ